jgi:type IV pilus biogenesis/stability protein PilW
MRFRLTRATQTWLGVLLAATLAAGCGGGGASKQPVTKTEDLDTRDKVRMAQSMLNAGRTGEAVELIEQALAEEPGSAQLHLFYGKVLFQTGRLDRAETAFRTALELDPYLTDAHNFLGVVLSEHGRSEEAEAEFRIALKDPAYPTPEMVYLNLGLLYAGQGRNDDAIAELRRAVEINPRFYKAHFELASLLDREGRIEEAAREYEVAQPDYRNVGEYHYRLGFVYFRLGDKTKAREALERAIEVAPGSNSAAQADDLLRMLD